jgi:ADP-heptose:LPS heptosyltransferase
VKILVFELWGIGDLVFASSFIRKFYGKHEITLLCKKHAAELLAPAYPSIRFIYWDSPWTVFRGKYHLWKWNWREIFNLIQTLKSEKYDVAVSVRPDPRDHFLMWWVGAKKRISFPRWLSNLFFLTNAIPLSEKIHFVKMWSLLCHEIDPSINESAPCIDPKANEDVRMVSNRSKPTLVLHCGARIPVRRWPEDAYASVIHELRKKFSFHLILIRDPDGTGKKLSSLADETKESLTLAEMMQIFRDADLFLGNDSGPGHIASALGVPTISIFGPGDPIRVPPWGKFNKMIIRDICPHRPCRDYCQFPEPYCLTKLQASEVLPEIINHLEFLIQEKRLSKSCRI